MKLITQPPNLSINIAHKFSVLKLPTVTALSSRGAS